MPDEVIAAVDQVSADWLTAVLTNSGALTAGEVAGFEVLPDRGNWSTNARLKLSYREGAQGARPERLFLKMTNTDLGDEFFDSSEVAYYRRDYVDVPAAPLVRCYDAAYSEEQQRYHLLLDDVSETHIPAFEKAPTLAYGLALAEGLAALHARWWGAKGVQAASAPIHDAAHILRFVEFGAAGVAPILAQFSTELRAHWQTLIKEIYVHHPQAIIARTADASGFTLIHGDAGPYNILVPREGDRPIYIIDRQPFDWSLTTWLGVYDLVYAIVLDWDAEVRRRLERPVLAHYHEQLIQQGVTGYTWEQLLIDYRLCAPMGVYVATEYCRGGANERGTFPWLPMLQRSLTACDDLRCTELWQIT
ncbi:MAG: hypothetical protein ACRDHL_02090 [Candidatus Promineifilaceae bacterium]